MQNITKLETKTYDPRWFIWTIVFLIVSGVSLVSYILITDTQENADISFIDIHRTVKK